MYKIKKNGDTKFEIFLNGDDPCIRLGDNSDDPTFTFPNESGQLALDKASGWYESTISGDEDTGITYISVPSTAKEIYFTGTIYATIDEYPEYMGKFIEYIIPLRQSNMRIVYDDQYDGDDSIVAIDMLYDEDISIYYTSDLGTFSSQLSTGKVYYR